MTAARGEDDTYPRLARALNAWARAIEKTQSGAGGFFQPGSPAWEDAHADYGGRWKRWPKAIIFDGLVATGLIADHLHALAAILRDPRTVSSWVSQTRTLAELSSSLHWRYQIPDPVERLRRSVNLTLVELAELQNLNSATDLDGATNAIIRSRHILEQRGHPFTRPALRRGRWQPGHFGARVPSAIELLRTVIRAELGDGGGQIADLMYRTQSAAVHGQSHTLSLFEGSDISARILGQSLRLSPVEFSEGLSHLLIVINVAVANALSYRGVESHAYLSARGLVGEMVAALGEQLLDDNQQAEYDNLRQALLQPNTFGA